MKPLLTIFVVAIIARLFFGLFVYQPLADRYFYNWNHPPGKFSWNSDDKYDDIARNLISGKGYTLRGGSDNKLYPALIRTPVYPFILAAQFYLFGDGFWINVFMNIIYQSLAGVILYKLTLMIFNKKKIALVSGLIWAIYPLPMLEAMGPHTGALYVLLLVSFAYYFYKFYKLKKIKYLVYFSILLTAVTLTRPVSLLFPLYLFIVTLIFKGFSVKDKIKQFAVILLIFIVGITPWMYRGYKITGEFIPLVTYKKPINYYMLEDYEKVQDEKGYFKGFPAKVMEKIKNPLNFLKDFSIGLVRFWYYGHTTATRIVNALLQFPLLILSILGICWAKKQKYLIFPNLIIICYFWLVYGAVNALSKYSFPMVVLLSPFATIGIINFMHTIFKTKTDFFLLQEDQ